MWRWLRRIALALAVLFIGLIVWLALTPGWPDASHSELHFVLEELSRNHYPPPIAANGVIETGPRWAYIEPTRSRFTAALRKSFPLGSREEEMQAALSEQGFVPARQEDCPSSSPGASPLRGDCPSHLVPRVMQYDWGGVPCNQHLWVRWTADSRHRLTAINGNYAVACL